MAHPPAWHVQTLGHSCRRIGPGVLISNVPRHTFRTVAIHNGCSNQWDFTGLPPRYVVVDASLFFFPFLGQRPDTPMPLRLRFRSEDHRFSSQNVRRNGDDYSVRVWYGPSASHDDLQAAARPYARSTSAARIALERDPAQGTFLNTCPAEAFDGGGVVRGCGVMPYADLGAVRLYYERAGSGEASCCLSTAGAATAPRSVRSSTTSRERTPSRRSTYAVAVAATSGRMATPSASLQTTLHSSAR